MLLRKAECLPRGPLRDRCNRLLQSYIYNSGTPLVVHLDFPIESILGGYRGFAQQA